MNPLGMLGGAIPLVDDLFGGFGGGGKRDHRKPVNATSFRNLADPQAQSAYNAPDNEGGYAAPAPSTMPMMPTKNISAMVPTSAFAQYLATQAQPAPSAGPPSKDGEKPKKPQGQAAGIPGLPPQPMPNGMPGLGTNAAGTLGIAKPMYGRTSPAMPQVNRDSMFPLI